MRYNDASGIMEFGTTTNHAQTFIQNGTERMRVSTTGRLLVNQTSSTNALIVGKATDGGYIFAAETSTANTSDVYYMSFVSSTGGQNGYIWRPTSSGVLALVSASDQRLKENISDATFNGLDVVNAVKVREFDWVETKTRSDRKSTRLNSSH